MLPTCPSCRMILRPAEIHTTSLCRFVQAVRELKDEARYSPGGRYVPEETFEQLCRAVEGLDTLTTPDLEALVLDGWDPRTAPRRLIGDQQSGVKSEPDAPRGILRLTVVPGGAADDS